MTFGWGERELGKDVAFTFLLFVAILSKPIFVFVSGLLFYLFVKLLVVFEKLKLKPFILIYILFSSHLQF